MPDPSISIATRQLSLGLRGAGTILLLVFLGLIVLDSTLLQLSTRLISAGIVRSVSDDEIGLLKDAIGRVLSPCVVFLVTWCSLKLRFRPVSSIELFQEFGLTPVSYALLIGSFCGGIAYHSILEYLLIPLFPPKAGLIPHPASGMFELSTGAIALAIVGGALLAPIAEEFLFRGVIYKALEQHWNKIVSIIVVSVVFSLIHPGAISSGYWLTHVSLFVFPLLLALSREVTGSLGSPILLHAGYNISEYIGYLYK